MIVFMKVNIPLIENAKIVLLGFSIFQYVTPPTSHVG